MQNDTSNMCNIQQRCSSAWRKFINY